MFKSFLCSFLAFAFLSNKYKLTKEELERYFDIEKEGWERDLYDDIKWNAIQSWGIKKKTWTDKYHFIDYLIKKGGLYWLFDFFDRSQNFTMFDPYNNITVDRDIIINAIQEKQYAYVDSLIRCRVLDEIQDDEEALSEIANTVLQKFSLDN